MLLRAITMTGELFQFEVKDCPVMVNDTTIALINLPNSPLLKAGTIARGDEETGIFEGDMVVDENNQLIGYIVYDAGFKVCKDTGEILPLDVIGKHNVITNSHTTVFNKLGNYYLPVRLKDGDFTFNLLQMVRVKDGMITVYHKLIKSIYLATTRICSGLNKNGVEVAFGDMVKDGTIVLHDLHPMVLLDNGNYRELQEGEDYDIS